MSFGVFHLPRLGLVTDFSLWQTSRCLLIFCLNSFSPLYFGKTVPGHFPDPDDADRMTSLSVRKRTPPRPSPPSGAARAVARSGQVEYSNLWDGQWGEGERMREREREPEFPSDWRPTEEITAEGERCAGRPTGQARQSTLEVSSSGALGAQRGRGKRGAKSEGTAAGRTDRPTDQSQNGQRPSNGKG